MSYEHLFSELDELQNIIELKERRVRTPEGARVFGKPIGSVIRADVVPNLPDIPNIPEGTSVARFGSDSVQAARDGARGYCLQNGLKPDSSIDYQQVVANRKRASEIADIFEDLPMYDDDAEPYYDKLVEEIDKQFQYMTEVLGIEVEFTDEDPYKNSKEMFAEVSTGRIRVLKTETTGSHAYLTDEQNNKFRAIHDFFGHAATGRGFGQDGEEAAWVHHSQMFTMDARAALTTETRGQNSFYNNRGRFADQKIALLPPQYWEVPNTFEKGLGINAVDIHDEDYHPLWKESGVAHCSNGRTLGIALGQSPEEYREQNPEAVEASELKISNGSVPAKPSERVTGSSKNPKGSSSSTRGGIEFSAELTNALKEKVKEHNEKMREQGKPAHAMANLGALKAVARRGAGAFSTSHRPGMTRNQWALARVNAFLHLLSTGKPKNPNYTVDYDLLPKSHPKKSAGKKDIGMVNESEIVSELVEEQLIDGTLDIEDEEDILEEGAIEVDITEFLTDQQITDLFASFEAEDWEEVDRLTALYEQYGDVTSEMALEGKAGGLDRNRGGAEHLRRYWTVGKGAAKIRWGTDGDWTRCVKQLSKYLGVRAKGYCTLRHKEMNGFYPGDKRNRKSMSFFDANQSNDDYSTFPDQNTGVTMLEHKTVGVKGLNVISEEDGIVEAIISVTGLVDEVKDVILPGAYEKTLAKRKPKGVWSHDWDTPVSKTLDVKELLPGDPLLPKTLPNGQPFPKGAGALAVKTQFNLDTQRGREAYADVVFFGDEQEWSIGYNVPVGGAKIDSKTGQRIISTLELYEYSPVLFGAMPMARTTSVKEAQMALKVLKGSAASWANQASTFEEDEEEKGMGLGMGMGTTMYEEFEDQMDVEEKERILSAEQMDLVKQAIMVLREILGYAEGEEKAMKPEDGEDMEDYNDDSSEAEEEDYTNLVDAIDSYVSDATLPQKTLEGMTTAASDFDKAMSDSNMDGVDVSGNKLLDMVEDAMGSSEDPDTLAALRSIAKIVAKFLDKVMENDEEGSEDEMPSEDNIEKKEEKSIFSLEELNEIKALLKE